ncbi:hypothetical protein D3C84_565420 [compost metagenome]
MADPAPGWGNLRRQTADFHVDGGVLRLADRQTQSRAVYSGAVFGGDGDGNGLRPWPSLVDPAHRTHRRVAVPGDLPDLQHFTHRADRQLPDSVHDPWPVRAGATFTARAGLALVLCGMRGDGDRRDHQRRRISSGADVDPVCLCGSHRLARRGGDAGRSAQVAARMGDHAGGHCHLAAAPGLVHRVQWQR